MTPIDRYPQDRGAVLLLSLILLTLLSLLVASALRASSYSVSAAGWSRIEHAVGLAADAALLRAMTFERFATDRVVTIPMPTQLPGIRASLATRYLGRGTRIPHHQFDAARHADLVGEYFALRATVTTDAGFERKHEQIIVIVARADRDAATPVYTHPVVPGTLADGALLPLARRIIEAHP